MKIVGGPRDGQDITISEAPGGTELPLEGMVLEYQFTEPGKVHILMYSNLNPKPSFPGLVERYKSHNGGWHYIAPTDAKGVHASPPTVTE